MVNVHACFKYFFHRFKEEWFAHMDVHIGALLKRSHIMLLGNTAVMLVP